MKLGQLKPFQESAVNKLLAIYATSTPEIGASAMLIGKPGSGKTFIAGELIERLIPQLSKHPYFAISRYKILYVTAAAVVNQTRTELLRRFNISPIQLKVISYSSLIAQEGKEFWTKVYPPNYDPEDPDCIERMGRILPEYEWTPFISPAFIILDESQRTRKNTSAAFRCIKGSTRLSNIPFLLMSGTPFQSAMEAETFARAINLLGEARKCGEYLPIAMKATTPYHPAEIEGRGMKQFLKHADHAIVRIPNIRTKFKNHLKIQLVDFLTPEEKAYYDKAFEDYIKQCIACKKSTVFGRKAKLVAQNKFRQRAEIIKADLLAKLMHEQRELGFSPMVACEFQTTIVKAVIILINKYGYKRDDIAIIWGGASRFTALKKQYTSDEIYALFTKALAAPESLTEEDKEAIEEIHKQIEQTGMDVIEELQDPTLRLGPQDDLARDAEIARFQSGKAQFCFYTFKKGSVGLSLHHCVDYFETKPETYRPKKGTSPEDMQWEYVKDGSPVPYKPNPRAVILSPTWNAIEWVQAIGRAHRLTSLSDTVQCGIYYRNTIEEKVAEIAAPKLRSLAVVAASKDAWMDAIDGIELDELLGKGEVSNNIVTLSEYINDELTELEQAGEER